MRWNAIRRAVAVVLLLASAAAFAVLGTGSTYLYTVKYVCGDGAAGSGGPWAVGPVVSHGLYCTSINVLNYSEEPVSLRHKVSVTWPSPGVTALQEPIVLGGNDAWYMDCMGLMGLTREALAGSNPALVEGMFVIKSDGPLAVWAVYTAYEGGSITIDVERVPAEIAEPDTGRASD